RSTRLHGARLARPRDSVAGVERESPITGVEERPAGRLGRALIRILERVKAARCRGARRVLHTPTEGEVAGAVRGPACHKFFAVATDGDGGIPAHDFEER